jgi:hypothetical protein
MVDGEKARQALLGQVKTALAKASFFGFFWGFKFCEGCPGLKKMMGHEMGKPDCE